MPVSGAPNLPALRGRTVVVTRPSGFAEPLVRAVRAAGAVPLRLPGLLLRPMPASDALRASWRAALRDDVLIFASPSAVRFAAALAPLQTFAVVVAVGEGTAQALRRLGVAHPLIPARQDSEGLIELRVLQDLQGKQVALIGAPGGRGLLRAELPRRGAQLREVQVYRRLPPRPDRRSWQALTTLTADARVLWSSADAISNLQTLLPPLLWQRLLVGVAVTSSERLEVRARQAGFTRIVRAASAQPADLIAAAAAEPTQ